MKTLTIYEAKDGRRFDKEADCLKYESQCDRIELAMQRLTPTPKEDGWCSFANGEGFVQQKKERVLAAYAEVLDVAKPIVGEDAVNQALTLGFAPRSLIGRYMDDSGHRCLYRAWGRFMNMDEQFREWGQGYFALNPEKGKQIDLTQVPA